MNQDNAVAEALERLAALATPGDLTTAESTGEGYIECPICDGNGEVDAKDYCNIDEKALGVQFYGIGNEFGVHEQLWSLVMNNLPTIIAALKARRVDEGGVS